MVLIYTSVISVQLFRWGKLYFCEKVCVLVLFSPVAGTLAHCLLFPQCKTQCVFFSYLFRLRKMRNRNITLYFSSF